MPAAEPASWAWEPCGHAGPHAQRAAFRLGLTFCCHCPDKLNAFPTRGSAFSFCTGPHKLCNWPYPAGTAHVPLHPPYRGKQRRLSSPENEETEAQRRLSQLSQGLTVSDRAASYPRSSGFNSGAAVVGELATSACLKALLTLLWAWATGTAPLPPTTGQARGSRCSGPCQPELGPGRANTHGTGSRGQFHHFKAQRLTKQSNGSKANTGHL